VTIKVVQTREAGLYFPLSLKGNLFPKKITIMKTQILLVFTLLSASIMLFTSNSSGPGLVQGEDLTGSPVSAGSCNNCHGGGTYNPKVTATLSDGGKAVTSYTPGKAYTFTIAITVGAGTPGGYGFQTVGLVDGSNATAGTFSALPSGVQAVTINSRNYIEHSRRSTAPTWSFTWTAPAKGTGKVNFYASGNAVNGNGGSNGDQSATLSAALSIAEGAATGINAPIELIAEVATYPNPVMDELQVKLTSSENLKQLTISVMDLNGRIMVQNKQLNPGFQFQTSFETSDWAKGVYLVRLTDGEKLLTKKIIKL